MLDEALRKMAASYEKRLCFFVGAVLIYSMLYMITPFVYLVEVTPLSRVAYLVIFFGLCWFTSEGFFTKHLPRCTPLFGYVMLFGLCLIVGALFNHQSALLGNIKSIVFEMALLLVFVTAGSLLCSNGGMGRFIKKLQSVSLVVWTAACSVSLTMFLFQRSGVISTPVSEAVRRWGYTEGRLFGVFQDPNYAAVFSLLLVIVSLYYLAKGKVHYKLATAIALVVVVLYTIGAASRTAEVCSLLAFACFIMVALIDKTRAFGGRRRLLLISMVVFAAGVLFVVGVSSAMGAYSEFVGAFTGFQGFEPGRRTDTSAENISNNRFEIWLSYLGSMDSDSFLFGRGYRGYMEQVMLLYPFSYIAESQYEAHNGYLLLLVSGGALCLILWLVILAKTIAQIFVATLRGVLDPHESVCVASAFAILLAKAFFFTSLWFVNELDTYLFALLLGFVWTRCSINNRGSSLWGQKKQVSRVGDLEDE